MRKVILAGLALLALACSVPFLVGAGVTQSTGATSMAAAATTLGATTDTKATVDGAGSLVAQLRRLTYEMDRAADLLGTISAGGTVDSTAWQANATSANALAADLVVKAGTASKKMIITSLNVNVQTTMTITVKDEDGTTLFGPVKIPAMGLLSDKYTIQTPWRITTADKNLEISSDTAGTITAWATGTLYD